MTPRNAICIVVDGLRASALGTYGNTWYDTPVLDRLAAESIVAEWMLIDGPELAAFYRGAWEGVHALRPASASGNPTGHSAGHAVDWADSLSLPLRLASAGVRQTLVTDDLWLDGHAGRMTMGQRPWDSHWLDTDSTQPAPSIAETALGQVFAAAIERFDSWSEDPSEGGNLLWVHARGMHGPWDAPESMRWELVEEDELQVPTWVQPPRCESGDDPDQWLRMRIAYAAQAKVLDACLGALLAALDDRGDSALVMLAGSRGLALGEHGKAGNACQDLHSELLHVPWLLRVPGSLGGPPPRFTGLTQPADISATLLDWFEVDVQGDGHSLLAAQCLPVPDWRQLGVARDAAGQWALRTPAWMLRCPMAEGGCSVPPQLYVKPDDRWEINDVASRCPQITEEMLAVLAEFERRLLIPVPLEPIELDSELLTPQR